MAMVWENSFEGTSGAVTPASTALTGDPISSVTGVVEYDWTVGQPYWFIVLGSFEQPGTAGKVGIELDDLSGWSVRTYFETLPTVFSYFQIEGYLGDDHFWLVNLDNDQDIYTILEQDVSGQASNFFGSAVRIEISRVGGTATARVWWGDPDSTAAPNLTVTSTTLPTGALNWIEAGSGGFSTYPVRLGSTAIGQGEWIGPVRYPDEEPPLVMNTLDGPDGVVVDPTNSAEYGTPVDSVSGGVEYYGGWSAAGTSSVALFGTAPAVLGGTALWGVSPGTYNYAIRCYALVPPGGWFSVQPAGTLSLTIDDHLGNYGWVGTDSLDGISENLVGQPIRIEVLRQDGVAELRIWWTNIHGDVDEPDYSDTADVYSIVGLDNIRFVGASGSSTVTVYVDEVAVQLAEDGWIGPNLPASGATHEVLFSGEAEGTTDVGGFVSATARYAGEASGSKSVRPAVESTVEFSGGIEHDAREIGLAHHNVEYSATADYSVSRDAEAEAGVEYSGEIEWLTDRSSEAAADIVYDAQAGGQSRVTLPDVTRVGLRYRLVVYEPNGEVRGQIPLPLNFSLGVPLNDLPSLSLEYLKAAPGYESLHGHCEVAVELATLRAPTYVEYPGMRFINIRNQSDPAERTGNVKYTMPHYGWQLRKARVMDSLNDEGQRMFAGATFGRIMHTFLTEAQNRGWNPGMSWDFTPQRDSAGQVWSDVYTIAFDAGQDLWTILETFAAQHACDFHFHRRVLRVFNPDTALNRDRTNQAVLHLGRDITSAPNDWSSEELASRVLVRGDENTSINITVPDAQEPWGTWETYVNQTGVSDFITLTILASWTLDKARQPLVQMTRGILFPTAQYMPFMDYQPGDYITAPGDPEQPWGLNTQERLRVRQITLVSVEGQGMEGALVLNERFVEGALRRDRVLNALTGGSGSNPGGGGGGTPPREDTRTPRAPTGLVVGSETFINEIGEPRGQITATWAPVDEATNGTPMDVGAYEVFVRWAAAGQTFGLRTTVDHPDTTAYMGPYDPDEVYEVRVRSVGRNLRRSAFSTTVPVLVERDGTPPDIPSTPIMDSRLGVVRATWDGLSAFGTPMSLDFDYVTVWMSQTASEEDGWEPVDTLYRQGVSVIPDLDYDVTYYFRFTAVDRSGNESDPSQLASISVQQLVPGDITPGSIGYELLAEGAVRDDILAEDAVRNRHIAAGQITGEKIRAYSIFADRIAVGNTRNLITDPKHMDEDLNNVRLESMEGEWSYSYDTVTAQNSPYLWRDDNPNGTYRYYWVQSVESEGIGDPHGFIPVAAEMGRVVSTARVSVNAMTAGNITVGMYVRYLDRQGNPLPDQPASIAPITYNSNTSNDEITSNNGAAIPEAAAYALVYVQVVLTGTNDSAWVRISRPFTALSNGQVLIENGAISANKIAANAVTADKIMAGSVEAVHIQANAIDTDQLAANAITAKHTITGALIQTTASANRGLKISSTGMQGFDNIGNQTFTYSSASGSVMITGRFQTGTATGNRVVIDSGLYAGRPAIQLHTGTTAQVQPVLYSMGAGSSEYLAGATLLHGRETTANSSGRNTLQLKAGTGAGAGGASLSREYGTYSGIGFAYENRNLIMLGQALAQHRSLDYQIWGRTENYSGVTAQTYTYGQAATIGGRAVMLTAVANTSAFFRAQVGATQATLSSVRIVAEGVGTTTYRVNYLTTWVAGSAG